LEHYADREAENAFEITKEYPSRCAVSLISGEADLASAPVALLADHPNLRICSDYCIGAEASVDSVLLLSNTPIEHISTIFLDYQSRTSNLLVQVLAKHFWKISPIFSESSEGYESRAGDQEAVVVIGDRAFEFRPRYTYCYDLATEWHTMTELPFVFAVWASSKDLDPVKLQKFNQALKYGIDHISDAIDAAQAKPFDINDYLRNKISYPLDDAKRQALALFLDYACSL